MQNFNDQHHILHFKREWTLRKESRYLRETFSLIPLLPRDVHEEIHRNAPPVPLLGYYALQLVVRDWEPDRNVIQSMDNLMISIEKASKHERAHPIERELAMLTIEAIDLQRPYIQDGVIYQP